jgi:hypothetical protein
LESLLDMPSTGQQVALVGASGRGAERRIHHHHIRPRLALGRIDRRQVVSVLGGHLDAQRLGQLGPSLGQFIAQHPIPGHAAEDCQRPGSHRWFQVHLTRPQVGHPVGQECVAGRRAELLV